MGDLPSILTELDRFCGQVSIALHNAEFQICTTLTIIVVLSVLLFPPRDDLDEV